MSSLSSHIDHTLLSPACTDAQIVKLCEEGHEHGFAAICVMPYYVPLAVKVMEDLGSEVAVCTTIGFPNGLHHTIVKVAEAHKALHDGARELDMVMNIGALKSGHTAVVLEDIRALALAAHESGAILKVILETSLLTDDEKRRACELAGIAGTDFVKTSTGFSTGGATVHDIRLMREASPPGVRIKASGGIRDYQTALAMIEAGAERIGTSSGIAILAGAAGKV